MSYAQMEAMLVTKIAEVRESERAVLRMFESAKKGADAAGLELGYVNLQQKIDEIDHLIAAMEAANQVELSLPKFVPQSPLQLSATL
jgi:hypothetical protein